MQRVGALFEKSTGYQVSYQCKASGLLAKGLRGKAISAEIYVSASRDWMDFMIETGMVSHEHVISPWGNELVVATAQSSPLQINAWSELATPKVATILIGDPSTAPFGRYAKQALEHTALWEQVKSKIATKKHITLLANALAEADDATVGIMFTSNTTARHRILFRVDESWHAPIRYYAAPLKSATERVIVFEFLRFLQSEEAQEIFKAEGFQIHAP